MSIPCVQEGRIVKVETLVGEHGKKLDSIDGKIDTLLDKVGSLSNNKGFIGGIAATGWLMGVLMVDIVKPFIKPAMAAMLALIK